MDDFNIRIRIISLFEDNLYILYSIEQENKTHIGFSVFEDPKDYIVLLDIRLIHVCSSSVSFIEPNILVIEEPEFLCNRFVLRYIILEHGLKARMVKEYTINYCNTIYDYIRIANITIDREWIHNYIVTLVPNKSKMIGYIRRIEKSSMTGIFNVPEEDGIIEECEFVDTEKDIASHDELMI